VLLVEIPAVVVLGLWFAFQLWSGSASFAHPEQGGGVAFFAHIGGFVFGMLVAKVLAVRRPLEPRYR
jgi:rhomboid family protein